MIASLSGKLLLKQAPMIIIDVRGVGYELLVPMSTYYNLPEQGQELQLYCYQHIREDTNSLYGFDSIDQRKLFAVLLKTSGVGPRLALTILSNYDAHQFVNVVNNNDTVALVRLPGVGKKTAERLLLELKDKLKKIFHKDDINLATANSCQAQHQDLDSNNTAINQSHSVSDAIAALESLGYKYNDVHKIVNKIVEHNSHLNSSEEIIKAALKEFR